MKAIVAIFMLSSIMLAHSETCNEDKFKAFLSNRTAQQIRSDVGKIEEWTYTKLNLLPSILHFKFADFYPVDNLIKYIMLVAARNSELCNEAKYAKIVSDAPAAKFVEVSKVHIIDDTDSYRLPSNTDEIRSELNVYLNTLNQDTLISYALAAEAYDRKQTNTFLLGGLHDYIYSLPKQKVVDILEDFTKKYPELNKKQLDQLIENVERGSTKVTLKDYLLELDTQTLISYALAAEAYDRTETNTFLLGGLHDYINNLNKSDIVNILLDYANKYPELTKSKFEQLISQRRSVSNLRKTEKNERLEYELSLVTDRKELEAYALGMAKFDIKQRGIVDDTLEGIEDYIALSSDKNLRNYIMRIGETHKISLKSIKESVRYNGEKHNQLNFLF
jgi:hypothetical protein